MPTIDWSTQILEPGHHGTGDQLCVDVRGVDAAWAQRFNGMADGHYKRGEVRAGRCGTVRYNEVEGHITADDIYGDAAPIRAYLTELAAAASGS